MTGLVILTFIPLIVAVGFVIRLRGEQKARQQAEQALAAIQQDVVSSEWFAILTHELRSPIAAILGYEELLEDGTFGDLSAGGVDATRRIRSAARQLLTIIEALEHLRSGAPEEEPEVVSADTIIAAALDAVRLDAQGRDTRITARPSDLTLTTRRSSAERALTLMLGAAVKVTPGGTMELGTSDSPRPQIVLRRSRLDPLRDSGQPHVPLTGAAVRLQLARAAIRSSGGAVSIEPDGTVRLELPRTAPAETGEVAAQVR